MRSDAMFSHQSPVKITIGSHLRRIISRLYFYVYIYLIFIYTNTFLYMIIYTKKVFAGTFVVLIPTGSRLSGKYFPYKCSVPLNRDDIFDSNKWLALTLSYSVVCDFTLCKYFLNFNNCVDFFAYERLPGCKLSLGTTHEKHLVLLTCPVPPP